MRKISKRGKKGFARKDTCVCVCAQERGVGVGLHVCVRAGSKTCPFGTIRDSEPPLGNAFSLNEFCNEAPRQTLS